MAWHLIETLTPGEATVSFSDGRTVEWGSVPRLASRLGVPVAQIVDQVRVDAHEVRQTQRTDDGDLDVLAIPVIAADGVVHAVSLWVAPSGDTPTPAPKAGALYVDLTTYRVQQTLECFMLSSLDPSLFNEDRDPSLFLRKVVRFDKVPEFVQMAAAADAADRTDKFNDFMNIRHDDGHLMNWYGIARRDPSGTKIRALGQDITDHSAPQVHTAALALVDDDDSLDRKSGALLIGFPDDTTLAPVMNYWMTPIPHPIRLDAANRDGHRIHPDDVAAVWECQQRLSESDSGSVLSTFTRIASGDGEWIPCQMTCAKYPADNVGASILVAKVRVLDSPEVAAHS